MKGQNSDTKLTASVLKQDANTQKVKKKKKRLFSRGWFKQVKVSWEDNVFVWLLDKYRAVNRAGNNVYQAKIPLSSHKQSLIQCSRHRSRDE